MYLGRLAVAGLAALAFVAGAGGAYAGHHRMSADVLRDFQQRVHAYVTLHREIERLLPPLEVSPDAREIQRRSDRLAIEIVAARQGVGEGAIIDAAVGAIFKSRIDEALGDRDRAAVLAAARNGGGEGAAAPEVHARFPWRSGSFMPAAVIAALPELPPELQYRFVGADLVLVDIGAGLVVDVLRGALPVVSMLI
jgi:hypothetical protein